MLNELENINLSKLLKKDIYKILEGKKYNYLIKMIVENNINYIFYEDSKGEYKSFIDINKILRKKEILKNIVINDKNISEFLLEEVDILNEDFTLENIEHLFTKNDKNFLVILDDEKPYAIIEKIDFYKVLSNKYKKMKEELDLVLNNLHESVCVIDKRKRVVFWSNRAEELFNIKKEKIISKKLKDFFPNALLLKVADEKMPIENIILSPKKDSYVILSGIPLYNKGKFIGAVATDRDVTELINVSVDSNKEKANDNLIRPKRGDCFDNIIGKTTIIENKIEKAAKVARSNSSIVISGETGTGKEVFAKTIHCYSERKGDFVAVNCSAIPESLFESEMFGYVEGAFTGASKKGRAGKFQMANKGTLFLDEIEALPLTMQPKLLRVLQDKRVIPVGSDRGVKVDVRIIAATNVNLRKLVNEGKFREDLFYRLNVVNISLPELRNRKEDIPLFINYFINKFCRENNIYNIPQMNSEVLKILMNYRWKGNIRELKNTAEHLALFSRNGKIIKESIPDYILEEDIIVQKSSMDLKENTKGLEIKLIKEAMEKVDGNKKSAADLLNIPRSTLYYKMKNYGLKEFI